MDETDFFNKDSMYWREVNVTSPNLLAEIELLEGIEIEGQWVEKISCFLLPFIATDVIYEMENGGAFKKNEVRSWSFVLSNDFDSYKDDLRSEASRKALVKTVDHSKLQSITLFNESGEVILTKAKV